MTSAVVADLEARVARARSLADPVARIDALVAVAWSIRGSTPDRAHGIASEARELAREAGYARGQAWAARTMGMTIGDLDGVSRIFDLATEARDLFDQTDDLAGRAGALDFLSTLHEHVGDLAGALPLALEALGIARDIRDPVRQGYALSNVGGIMSKSGQHEVAIGHLEEALALFESVGDADGAGAIASRLAQAHAAAGHQDEAWAYAERCLRDAKDRADEFGLSNGYGLMAKIEEERGHHDEAERLFRAALDSLEHEVVRHVLGAELKVGLAQLLLRRGAIEEAEQQLTEALEGVRGNKVFVVSEAEAHAALAALREQQGRLTEAMEHLRAAQALRDRIAKMDAKNRVAQAETRAAMEAAKKDAEIHKLRFVELHQMQSKLLEAEKMSLLGKLAAGTAHEINTPIGVLSSNLDVLAQAVRRLAAMVPEGSDDARAARRALTAAEACQGTSAAALQRLGAIAASFRRFTELDQAERRAFDLAEGLASAVDILEPTLPEGVRVERALAPVPRIDGWPREVNAAFMTVLQNAAEAIRAAGVIRVETEADAVEVRARIQDSGRGMAKRELAHLFDVAWSDVGGRTKMRLGLTAAYTTMQRHGGTIEVQSVEGEGTTVTFRFPRADGAPSA